MMNAKKTTKHAGGKQVLCRILAALAVLYPLGVRGEALFFTGCFLCLPFGTNPIVFREAKGLDAQKAAGMTLVSYVFSILTVPAMFMLFRTLSGLG